MLNRYVEKPGAGQVQELLNANPQFRAVLDLLDQCLMEETPPLLTALNKVILVAADGTLLEKSQLKGTVDMLIRNMHAEQFSAVMNVHWVQEWLWQHEHSIVGGPRLLNVVKTCAQELNKDAGDCVKIIDSWIKGDAVAAKMLTQVTGAAQNLNEILEMDDIRPSKDLKRKSSLEQTPSDVFSIKTRIANEEKKGIEASVELYRDLITHDTKYNKFVTKPVF